MYHGKKKDIEKKEDNEMTNYIKALYSKSMNTEVAKELVKVLPEDYFAQNILKSNLDLEDSLKTNLKSLYANPKSYSAWYHRIYILTNSKISFGIVEKEYELVNLCLDLDSRNFHCWNYKRFLDKIANKNGYKEIKHYRNDISESIFAKDFSNFSAAHDMLVNGGQFDNLISQLYTDPLDISPWTVYNILQCRKAHNKNNFYIKVYSDKFVICFSTLPNSLDVTLNGTNLDSDIYFKNTVYDIKLKNTHVLCVNDVIVNHNNKVVLYDDFIDEILELEDRCIFGYLEKLIYTESISEREEIVKHLVKADPMRRGYYKSLVQQCYHIVA